MAFKTHKEDDDVMRWARELLGMDRA